MATLNKGTYIDICVPPTYSQISGGKCENETSHYSDETSYSEIDSQKTKCSRVLGQPKSQYRQGRLT